MRKQHRGDQALWDNVPDRWNRLEHQIDARVLELHAQGASVAQITQLTGVHPRRIRRLLPR
ncbi:helix-turn-helix domain-containing protein [Corynebacterium occultum]|uniref:helix-turn-helix domain-containing protein n=1 Tax=Corynebacterium occultum TaxID=2675219 RepID=UPI0038B3453D